VYNDASLPNASGMDAAKVWDGCGIGDAGAMAQDGAYGTPGWTCTIPSQARSSATCNVMPYPNDSPPHCPRPSEYELFCAETIDQSALGCNLIAMEEAPDHGYDYCCSCEGTDAATGCVNVDPSAYDRSCTRDSDCMFIWAGMSCPGGCALACGLGNAAINVDSQACYEQTLAPLNAASLDTVCHCPNQSSGSPGPVCLQGVCTVPNNQ
jgi:hypothetical protein